jgi:hypothetical protein
MSDARFLPRSAPGLGRPAFTNSPTARARGPASRRAVAQTYSRLWTGWATEPPRASWAATIMKVKTHLEMMSMMV